MKNAGFSSRVIALALKDRAAILLGGHRADAVIWFDSKTHEWTSSKYYFPDGKLPEWVLKLNQTASLLLPKGDKIQDRLKTPFGLELTEQAAENAIQILGLGQSTSQKSTQGKSTPIIPSPPSLLAVSFSSYDYAGHQFGPNSPEMEAMTLAEDRLISRLINFIKQQNGNRLDDILFVLTGDHGIAPDPDWLKTRKISSGRILANDLASRASLALNEKFGKPSDGSWISAQIDLNFYLNSKAILEKGLEKFKVEAEAKAILAKAPGIAQAFTQSEYLNRRLPPGIFEKQILNTYFPGRSGDVILIPLPYFFASDENSKSNDHTTGYSYDRMVPLILAGAGIRAGTYLNPTHAIDIAPTLSWLMGVLPPSLSEGRILTEALKDATAPK
jgi:hypothetical protein